MKNNKIDNQGLAKLVKEHVEANNRIEEMEQKVAELDAVLERFESGEEITEEELNELMGGLGAIGKWGAQKAKTAFQGAGKAVAQAAGDVKQQYQKGQRASAINKQRKAVDKQYTANNEKVQDLAMKGKAINDAIRKYQNALSRVGSEYEKLTGKTYVPGRAVANAKRYVDESQKKK
ncbi:MAG: hypothetical protein P8J32_09005 [bacterium]|nr:hypothetical protein [bacterium]